MAEQTLLQLTQNVLSRLNSDQVNSISDTVESLQVAKIIENKYYDMVSRGDLPSQTMLRQLDSSDDADKPTLMYVPSGVTTIDWIKYFDANPSNSIGQTQFGSYSHGVNTDLESNASLTGGEPAGYKYVNMIGISDFLDMINSFNPGEPDVGTYDFTEGGRNFTLYYKDDIQPQYCTVIENNYVLFDAFDKGFDTTLQTSKSMFQGVGVSQFQLTDNFIPDIDDNQFSLLLNEAVSLAFYEIKQMPHQKADQEVRRQWSTVQKNKVIAQRPTPFDSMPNFGRVPRTGGYSVMSVNRWMRGR